MLTRVQVVILQLTRRIVLMALNKMGREKWLQNVLVLFQFLRWICSWLVVCGCILCHHLMFLFDRFVFVLPKTSSLTLGLSKTTQRQGSTLAEGCKQSFQYNTAISTGKSHGMRTHGNFYRQRTHENSQRMRTHKNFCRRRNLGNLQRMPTHEDLNKMRTHGTSYRMVTQEKMHY